METVQKEICFQTEDGWTIYGSLHMPAAAAPQQTVPAALLLHAAGHDRDAFASFVYPGIAQILASQGVAALSIDWRGRGQSIGELEYHSFNEEQRAKIYLDVKAALNYLASLSEIDSDRMAVLAEEASAGWAVLGADGDPRVKVLAFISGRFSDTARDRLASREHTPVLCVVSKEDKPGFADMSALFARSKSEESDFRLYEDMGIGTTMFALWRYRYPDERGVGFLAKQGVDTEKIGLLPKDPGDEKPIEDVICDWIVARLKSLGRLREVSFATEDGFTIYGNLLTPEKEGHVPGVVMVHSGLSDRYIFHDLERLFVKNGIAVLNIDWRGRGKSRDRGSYFTLPKDERDRAHLDVKAAINLLADQPEVDAQKIGIVGTYIGAKFAAAAALGDSRIGAVVMLSGYIPSGKEREEIAGISFPILFIGSRGIGAVTNAMADLYELTKDRGSELILYGGGALGYQLFEVDETLEKKIVDWVKHHLSNK